MVNENTQQVLQWWLNKNVSQITSYINTVIQFEELTPDELEKKRRSLLLEFLDTNESNFFLYLFEKIPDFLDVLYNEVYSSSLIFDSLEEMEKHTNANA